MLLEDTCNISSRDSSGAVFEKMVDSGAPAVYENDEEESLYSHYVLHFVRETSCHGLSHMGRSDTPLAKALWLTLFVSAVVVCGLHLSTRIDDYMSLQYQEMLSTEYRSDVPYPDITLCNIFPVSRSKKTQMDALVNDSFHKPLTDSACSASYKMFNFTEGDDTMARLVDRKRLVNVSHKLTDFVQACLVSSITCNTETDFTPFFDSKYYQCYTLHTAQVVQRLLRDVGSYPQPGASDGISLVLFLENTDGIPTPGDSEWQYDGFSYSSSTIMSGSGARVVVHPSGTQAFPAEQGIDLAVGQSTSISLRARNSSRLAAPYLSNCTDAKLVPGTGLSYSQLACFQSCVQKNIAQMCNCTSVSLPSLSGQTHLPTCGSNLCDYSDLICASRITDTSTDACAVQCPRPCQEISYSTKVSSAYWPGDEYQQSFLFTGPLNNALVSSTLRANTSKARLLQVVQRGLILKNFLRVNIYFEDYFVEVSEEAELYNIYALLSDVGGTMGLWIGTSVLTFAEYVDCLAYSLIGRLALNSIKRRKSRSKTYVPNPFDASAASVKDMPQTRQLDLISNMTRTGSVSTATTDDLLNQETIVIAEQKDV